MLSRDQFDADEFGESSPEEDLTHHLEEEKKKPDYVEMDANEAYRDASREYNEVIWTPY